MDPQYKSQFNSVKDIEEIVYGMGKWDPSITHPFLQKFFISWVEKDRIKVNSHQVTLVVI